MFARGHDNINTTKDNTMGTNTSNGCVGPVETANSQTGRGSDEFNSLCRRYAGLVQGVCRRALWAYPSLVDDAIQTVFLILHQKMRSTAPNIFQGGWFQSCAVNVCRNLSRRETTRNEYERLASEEYATTGCSDRSEADKEKVLRCMDEVLLGIPDRQRTALVGHYLEGLDCQRLGVRMGCSENAVRVLLARGREALRTKMVKRGIQTSVVALIALLDNEGAVASNVVPSGEIDVAGTGPVGASQTVKDAANAVIADMDRAAAKAMWGKIGAAAVGLAVVGVGTAVVVSHLQSAPPATFQPVTATPVATTSWRIESVVGNPSVRRGEATVTLKAGDLLCLGDWILTSSNQEAQVVSDAGDRILLREEGEIKLETGNWKFGTGENDGNIPPSSLHLLRGAVVAQVKRPSRFATPHAGMEAHAVDFFLMVTSALTTNGVPWSFTRLDVTEGSAKFLPFSISNLKSEIPLVARQAVCAGTDQEGRMIEPVARKSDGLEVSPKYGGGFYREFVEQLERHGSNGMFSASVVAQNARVYSPDEIFQMVKRDSRLQSSRVEGGVSVEYQGGNPPLVHLPLDLGGASEGRIVIDWSVVDISTGRREVRIATLTKDYVPNPAPPPFSSFRSGTTLVVLSKIEYRTERRFRRAGVTPHGVPIQVAEETVLGTDSGTPLAAPSCGWETGDVNTYMLLVQNMRVLVRGVRVEIHKRDSH